MKGLHTRLVVISTWPLIPFNNQQPPLPTSETVAVVAFSYIVLPFLCSIFLIYRFVNKGHFFKLFRTSNFLGHLFVMLNFYCQQERQHL